MFEKLKEYYKKYGSYFVDVWYYIFIILFVVVAIIILS